MLCDAKHLRHCFQVLIQLQMTTLPAIKAKTVRILNEAIFSFLSFIVCLSNSLEDQTDCDDEFRRELALFIPFFPRDLLC